ncbi:MAG: ATP-binding cassette domain-containing protein [Magnetococcales bacterium]|nr:ATP-binding cassette domain-containing protein [Magnetococcales bacterium]
MSGEILITAEKIRKKFCLGLKRSMWYGVRDVARELAGRPRSATLRKEEFWALDDVSFTVRRGEILGVIGPNGSGKTTLLRLINGLLMPDAGEITLKGRIGALIQLGAGFSPVLTGRENIAINAAVLGITRAELKGALEEIIEFAGLGDFIDAPVMSYSSGMRARLGFAVAIHMKPDILLVDEVLAVGDLVFRNKALERMHALSHSGVAVLFVSHNLGQVDRLCTHALYLNKGRFVSFGRPAEVIARYVVENTPAAGGMMHHPGTERAFVIREAGFFDPESGGAVTRIQGKSAVGIRVVVEVREPLKAPLFCFMLEPAGRSLILGYVHQPRERGTRPDLAPGRHVVTAVIDKIPFLPGRYTLRVSVSGAIESQILGKVSHLAELEITPRPDQYIVTNEAGLIELDAAWQVE